MDGTSASADTRTEDAAGIDSPAPSAQRILDAAILAIDERGEAALRVQDIVRVAGVQVPVLYRYFGNREGLVQAAQLERLRRDLRSEMATIHAALDDATSAEEFRALMDAVLQRVVSAERRTPRARRVNVLGSTYGRPQLVAQVAAAQHVAIDGIADLLRRPAELGWLRDDLDVSTFATWLAGAAIGRIVAELDPDRVDFATYDEMWLDAIRFTLFG